MKPATILATTLLILAPTFAFSMGCSSDHEQVMSCAEGTVLDKETGTCVPLVTG